MKIAYIAHPISGDVTNNLQKIVSIVRRINLTEPDTVPFVPYFADLHALNDEIPQERARGIKNGHALITSGLINEVRVYGDRISAGVQAEINLAREHNIPVISYQKPPAK